ncbi:S41 family peptidase [candidate division KSB1 bacterium]
MYKRLSIICVLLCLLFSFSGVQADPVKFARYPNSSHGKIAFTYHGDIWIAQIDGSNPIRLTDHIAMDTHPRFSPDGNWIAFNSNRMGNGDVWVIPVTGGEPRQLTFHTTGDNVQYWTPDGSGVIVSSSRNAHSWGSPLFIVPLDGSIPVAMDMDFGSAGMISQDGSKVAFNRYSIRYWRKHYKGNNQTDVWVQDLNTKEITQLTDIDTQQFRSHVQDAYPMWGADGMIYFLSERNDIFNIWKVAPDGGEPVQVTSHRNDGVQFPSISPDGKIITYENEFDLWKLEIPQGRPERITIDMSFDVKRTMVEYLSSDSRADGFTPSPNGDYVAVDFHGEIYKVPSEQGVGEMLQVTSSGWRERYQTFSPDGKYIAYVSDESLEEEIWLFEIATGNRTKLTEHESTKSRVVWSQDSKQFAYTAANRLFVYDMDSGRNSELAYNQSRGYSVREFSQDGKWLVLSHSDPDQNSEVYLFNIAERTEYNISQNPFRDSGGVLTKDGKNVIITSNRDNGTNHIFIIPLQQVKENPNDPLVKERLKNEKPEEAEFAINIDINGIDRRAVQLTRGSNSAGSFFLSEDGNTIYYTSSDDQGPGLFSMNLDGSDQKKVSEGSFSGLTPTADRKMVFYRQQNGIYKMTLPNRNKGQVQFTLRVKVDKRAEWEQVFEESWRVMKYRFYDENMHGYDWDAIKREYKPYLKYVGENQDVYDLANEMIGELNASHTGVSGPSGIEVPSAYTTRLLGFEMEPDRGSYKITHIYYDGPADKEWIDLDEGEYVHAIDGKEIKAGDNYWKILNEKINNFATVTVSSSPQKGTDARDIRIETITSLRNIKYEEFVKKSRDFVEKESDGKIAYVHIRSMNQESLRRFENEIDRFWNKEGIIIDIRYNGGGNIDEPLLDILERKPYAFVNSRSGARTWGRRHRQTIAGPKVMMVNQRSFSDAEMTPAGFRVLGLGSIVGHPTGAGVIWTGSYTLLNGGRIRTPGSLAVTYDPSKPNKYGINLENYGVPPDVFVENTPVDELTGYDRELKAAVDEALRMLKEGKW